MKTAVIVNPTAGRGLAGRRIEPVLRAFDRCGVRAELFETRLRGDAVSLARSASADFDVVVVVGGDGTVHETASGLCASGGHAALAVIPSGSGNDFAKVLRMPSRPARAVEAILASPVHPVDVGVVTVTDDDGELRDGLFINAFGIGFDSVVAERASRSRKVRGTLGYLSVALRTLAGWTPIRMAVSSPDWHREGSTLLVTLGNGTCSGGGFYLTPEASVTDGLLDFCHVAGISAARMLLLLPRVLWGGHLNARPVTYFKTASALIESAVPVPVHLDGEILSNKARRVVIKVRAGALSVRAPLGGT